MPLRLLAVALALVVGACGRGPPPAGATASSPPEASPSRVVNVFNWADGIDPAVPGMFERETGIKVNYDTFDSEEFLETKLLTGKTGYDVVVVSGHILERLIPVGTFRKLDPAQLPNRRNLDAALMALLAGHDPGNQYAVGYDWGTTGIGYDLPKVKALAPDAPLDSWALVYDPRNLSRLSACGVSVLDAPAELITTALAYLGRDPNSTAPPEIAAAGNVLTAIRPYIRKVDSGSQLYDLAAGDICIMVTWPANVVGARRQAVEAGAHPDFRYVIPREGTIAWFDTVAIPADAPHVAEAHAFIDFLLRPEIAARNANFLGLATMNEAALPLVEASLRDDPSIYPPPEVRARLRPLRARSAEETRADTDLWRAFRANR